jgi:hypothetical protein
VKAATPATVILAPYNVTGGKTTTKNTVTLDGPAAAGGAAIAVASSDNDVAVAPSEVTVAAGTTTSPDFTISTTAVAAQTAITIFATYNNVTKTATLTVNPPQVKSLTLSPATVRGGRSTTNNTVTLNGPAASGGAPVMLTSSDTSVAQVPGSVVVPAGMTSATFTITTSAVTTDTVVAITATYGGATQMANLTVTP